MFDKIFRVGLLVIATGFLITYIYDQRAASRPKYSPCGRYSLTASAGERLFHTVYMLDTQEGTVYFAQSTPQTALGGDLRWKLVNPKAEAK